MPHSSGRGQVEPLAALAAVLAVTAGLTIYAGALTDAVPTRADRNTAETALSRVTASLESAGVVDTAALDEGLAAVPTGWRGNLTLRAGGKQWTRGPVPPTDADRATTRVSVRTAPMEVRSGELRLVVWR